jgi:uncharacterized protein
MRTIFVDANAFLRFLLNDIPEQKKEFEKLLNLAKASKIKLNVPQIIIFEINFSLQKYYKFSKSEVVDKLQTIIETPYLRIQDGEALRDAVILYSQNDLSLTDCFLYIKAKEKDAELFTFDKVLKALR